MSVTPSNAADETAVIALYNRLIDAWNRRSASDYSACFTPDANLVGFDGSLINGQSEIHTTLTQIFNDHKTNPYVTKVREVRFLASDVALLRGIVGMISPDTGDIIPAVNAIQSLVATQSGGQWLATLFQNTPAQFHGRPDLAQALTEELRGLLKQTS